jgi:uncharacterized protein
MANIIVASTRKSAGKTSVIIGLARNLERKMAYVKPLGDRLLYRKKRLWDYDAAVVLNVLGSNASAEELTIGFEPSKLRYMYEPAQVAERLRDLVKINCEDDDRLLFVEGGSDLSHGTSVDLDALSVARAIGGKLVIVAAGGEDRVVDDVAFFKRHVDAAGVDLLGVIVNKVSDPDDFELTHLEEIRKLGIPVLGVLPQQAEMTRESVRFLSDCLFARVLSGEKNLDRMVHHVVVGASTSGGILREPVFQKENKLVITSGDRSDIVLAALETSTSGVVLTNNILPPANIVAKAAAQGMPLLLVPADTFAVAKQVDDLEPLVTREDMAKQNLLAEMIAKRVNLDAF